MIEKSVHQICIVAGFALPSEMPAIVMDNMSSFKSLQTGYSHKLWCGEEIRELIKKEFERDVIESFDLLMPYSYKCDLARLCIMYIYGGIYADLGIRLISRFDLPKSAGFAAFRAISFLTDSWTAISNGLFLARPGRPELIEAIQAIVANCRARNYDVGPYHPTGPVLFGRSIASAMLKNLSIGGTDDQWIGEVRRDRNGGGITYHVSPDGQTIAINIKAGRTLKDLGLAGANSYQDAWRQKAIFADDAQSLSIRTTS